MKLYFFSLPRTLYPRRYSFTHSYRIAEAVSTIYTRLTKSLEESGGVLDEWKDFLKNKARFFFNFYNKIKKGKEIFNFF
jgi:hypothetical protein